MKNLLLVLLIIIGFFSCKSTNKKTEIRPQKTNITESVYAAVTIKPEISYHPQPTRSGIINKIYAKEGELVKKGQKLFQIEPTTSDKVRLTNAEMNLVEAKSNYLGENSLIENIKLEIQTVKEQKTLDSINLKRQEYLLSKNIGKKIDYDNIKLQYENSKNKLKILEKNLEQTRITLKNNYKKAKNTITIEKDQLADFEIHSKIDGKVYSINKEEGDFISSQEKISEIGSSDSFKIEMDIDEVDITKIELGDSVLIVLDAYPDDVFVATVKKIFDKKNSSSQTFRVEAAFLQLPSKLYYGLSGEANIVVSKRENTLVIPTEYLKSNNTVVTSDGEKTVIVGLKNLEYVEILSGLDTSSILKKPNQ